MIKLSELKDDEMLLINEKVMTKENLLNDLDWQKQNNKKLEVYTTKQYHAKLDAKDIMETAIEYEYQNMFEDWDTDIWNDITKEDLKDIQIVLDRILERSKDHNVSYCSDEVVQIDFEEEK